MHNVVTELFNPCITELYCPILQMGELRLRKGKSDQSFPVAEPVFQFKPLLLFLDTLATQSVSQDQQHQ